jgi:DNA-binding transcriptional ArsR family regulator
MPEGKEEIYSIMFTSLKHPARRKILRILAEKSLAFSEMLEILGISSSNLTYHLENLGELVSKDQNGVYRLSTFGQAAVGTMKIVEDAPQVQPKKRGGKTLKWKALTLHSKQLQNVIPCRQDIISCFHGHPPLTTQ